MDSERSVSLRYRRFATLRRSIRLFRAFRHEQTERDAFYQLLADDSARQVAEFVHLDGRSVLDVGGGPGYFSAAFEAAGAGYLGLEPDVGELSALGQGGRRMVRGSGTALPIGSEAVDVCYSSNVLEHVDRPEAMLAEMVRVTKPGGTVFLSYTPWLSPWGGHETAPWHYLGGGYARRRYRRRLGHEPKNRFGESLFAVSVGTVLRWVRRCPDVTLVQALPRYYPWWAAWIVGVPLLREFATWNFVVVLRRK